MLNLKGGVAKTTNTVAIAECLADQGKKVLVIDADHQCTASELLLGEDLLGRCEHRGSRGDVACGARRAVLAWRRGVLTVQSLFRLARKR